MTLIPFLGGSDQERGDEEASAWFSMPAGFFGRDDIRWEFDLAGGALMDIGSYRVACLRDLFGAEPEGVLGVEVRLHGNDKRVEEGIKAWYRFPGGGVRSIDGSISQRHEGWWSFQAGNEEVRPRRRTVTMWAFPGVHYWHSIVYLDQHTIRRKSDGNVVKSWERKEYKTAYTWDWKQRIAVRDGPH